MYNMARQRRYAEIRDEAERLRNQINVDQRVDNPTELAKQMLLLIQKLATEGHNAATQV